MKDKKCKTVHHSFIEIENESKHQPNKSSVDQGREFYNSFMQQWLDYNDILMYSTDNEGKPIIAERFIRTSKTKTYKKMTTSGSKSYLGYLNKLLDECNNTHHHSIDKKPTDGDYSALTEKFESSHKVPQF